MKKTIINHDREVAIYNADRQELIGIFRTPSLVARYIFNEFAKGKVNRVTNALSRKTKIMDTKFDFYIACRYASAEQLQLLDGDYTILNGYDQPLKSSMKGFTDTAGTLKKQANINYERYKEEKKRIINDKKIIS
jgi:hypothetical protein